MSNSLESIHDRLRQIVQEQCPGLDVPTPETDLYDAGLTSLTAINLMMAIEESFEIQFPDEALNRQTFSSIGAMAAVLRELLLDAVP